MCMCMLLRLYRIVRLKAEANSNPVGLVTAATAGCCGSICIGVCIGVCIGRAAASVIS